MLQLIAVSPASRRLEVAPTSHIGGGGAEPGRKISFGLQFAITADEFLLMSSFHLESRSLRHPVILTFFFAHAYTNQLKCLSLEFITIYSYFIARAVKMLSSG